MEGRYIDGKRKNVRERKTNIREKERKNVRKK